jgi:hypothetical protein
MPTSKRGTWLGLIVLLLFFIIISYIFLSQKPKDYQNYLSHSPSPTGVKAIFTYLESELNKVESWSHSPDLLTDDEEDKLLIMVEPTFIPETEEMNAYKSFIEKGNTILLFKENPQGMFGLKSYPIEKDFNEEYVEIFQQDEKKYHAQINSIIRLVPNNGDEILLSDESGALALKRKIGEGELISVVTPEWMTNGSIKKHEHISLILSLINEVENRKTVMFDEYLHGQQNQSTLTTIYPNWFLLLMLQFILLTVLWLWTKGKRFGSIFVPREGSVRFSDEGLKALAAWYSRGRMYRESLLIQADYNKLLIQEKWGIPYSKDWLDIEDSLVKKVKRIPPGEIQPFLKGLSAILQKERISKKDYLGWSKKIDQLRKELEVDNEQ